MFRRMREGVRLVKFYLLHKRSLQTIEKWQSARLHTLVRHAAEYVPAYRDLFAASGVSPETIRRISDLPRLPITDKGFFLGRETEEYIDHGRRTHTVWKKTSGTTGKPFTLLVSNALLHPHYADFVCYRFLLGFNVFPGAFDTARIAHINVRAPRRANQLFITISDFLSDPEVVIRKIADYRPDVVASYTSILFELAKKVSENPTLLPEKPRFAASFGEMLTPHMRRFIEDALGCEVYDRYGGGEIGAVALECGRHDGMHVNSESAIVEIVDDKSDALPPGQYGRVIVTDLLNYNMPFIRYDIGDRGMLTRDRCACGLETPRLWLEGRYSAFLIFGGRKIHHLEFDGALDGFMHIILQYQIVKLAEDEMAVRVVPGPLFDSSSAQVIEAKMRKIVGPDIRVSIEKVASISRTLRGKSHIVLDESMSVARSKS